MLSRVMVELLLVRDGISSTDIRTSGPGSPISNDWKLSSVIDEGAVEIRWASYDIGDLGDGKADDCVIEYGLIGAKEAVGRLRGLTSTGANSLPLKTWRGDGVAESIEARVMIEELVHRGSSGMTSSWSEVLE